MAASGCSKANSRRKNNKMRVAKRSRCWVRCQKRNELNRLKGGHRKLKTFANKQFALPIEKGKTKDGTVDDRSG